jgi:hypothetical protein
MVALLKAENERQAAASAARGDDERREIVKMRLGLKYGLMERIEKEREKQTWCIAAVAHLGGIGLSKEAVPTTAEGMPSIAGSDLPFSDYALRTNTSTLMKGLQLRDVFRNQACTPALPSEIIETAIEYPYIIVKEKQHQLDMQDM